MRGTRIIILKKHNSTEAILEIGGFECLIFSFLKNVYRKQSEDKRENHKIYRFGGGEEDHPQLLF